MKDTMRLLMMQLMADAKDEFMNEFREIVKEVIRDERTLLDRTAESLNNKLTYDEIAEEYKISTTTLKKLKKEGLLIPICRGGKYLIFERSQVEDCLRDRPRLKPLFLSKTGS